MPKAPQTAASIAGSFAFTALLGSYLIVQLALHGDLYRIPSPHELVLTLMGAPFVAWGVWLICRRY